MSSGVLAEDVAAFCGDETLLSPGGRSPATTQTTRIIRIGNKDARGNPGVLDGVGLQDHAAQDLLALLEVRIFRSASARLSAQQVIELTQAVQQRLFARDKIRVRKQGFRKGEAIR